MKIKLGAEYVNRDTRERVKPETIDTSAGRVNARVRCWNLTAGVHETWTVRCFLIDHEIAGSL
jgi:hypothetical protein